MVYLFVLYTTFGGYRSVLRTDAFNLVLLVLSLVVLLVLMIGWVGGFPELYAQAGTLTGSDSSKDLLSLFNDPLHAPDLYVHVLGAGGLGLAANPQYMVRVLSARNARSARWDGAGLPDPAGLFVLCAGPHRFGGPGSGAPVPGGGLQR